MKKSIIICIIISVISCSTTDNQKPAGKPQNNIQVKNTVKTGWNDQDTYTVKVSSDSRPAAIERARHQILKDIINVRVRNGSRYTDITKIREEFKKPLENGKVIQEYSVKNGVLIYYQIRDKGLKKKFERK